VFFLNYKQVLLLQRVGNYSTIKLYLNVENEVTKLFQGFWNKISSRKVTVHYLGFYGSTFSHITLTILLISTNIAHKVIV